MITQSGISEVANLLPPGALISKSQMIRAVTFCPSPIHERIHNTILRHPIDCPQLVRVSRLSHLEFCLFSRLPCDIRSPRAESPSSRFTLPPSPQALRYS